MASSTEDAVAMDSKRADDVDQEKQNEDVPSPVGEKALVIKVLLPNGEVMKIPLMQALETVYNVKQLILEIPEFCHMSCCHLEAVQPHSPRGEVSPRKKSNKKQKSVPLDDYKILDDCEELKQGYYVRLVQDRYDPHAIIEHVRRLKAILANPPIPLVNDTVEEEVEQEPASERKDQNTAENDKDVNDDTEEIKDEEAASIAEKRRLDRLKARQQELKEVAGRLRKETIPVPLNLESFYAGASQTADGVDADVASGVCWEQSENISKPRCLSSLQFSGWNPPMSSRRMMGDLAYLEVSIEGEANYVYHITATAGGFFINSTRNGKFNSKPSQKSCQSWTLVELLQKASSAFRKNYATLFMNAAEKAKTVTSASALTELDLVTLGYAVSPNSILSGQGLVPKQWNCPKLVTEAEDSYDIDRSYGAVHDLFGVERGQARDWNDEYQAYIEMPCKNLAEQVFRCRSLDRVQKEFVDNVSKTAVAIMQGCIAPMNPGDPEQAHVYVYNQIFFSKVQVEELTPIDSIKKYKVGKKTNVSPVVVSDIALDSEAMVASYSVSNHDLQGVRSLGESIERLMRRDEQDNVQETEALRKQSLKTLMTVIVDHLGQRIVAQSIIPGILKTEHTKLVVYGSVDYGKTIMTDDVVANLWKRAVQLRNMGASEVCTSDGNKASTIYGPVESKAIRGAEGRTYALDLLRLTPYDLNYYKKRASEFTSEETGEIEIPATCSKLYVALCRPELVDLYCQWREMKYQQEVARTFREKLLKSKEDKGEDVDWKVEIDKESLKFDAESEICFDPNAFTNYKQPTSPARTQGRELVEDIASFLVNVRIPNFVEEIRRTTITVTDGETLTKCMHTNGINMRYLGEIASRTHEAEGYITKSDQRIVPPTPQAILELCEVEMVSRALKWICRERFRSDVSAREQPGVFLASLLNEVFTDMIVVWQKIAKHIANHYDGYVLKIWGPKCNLPERRHPLVLLRRICQLNGIRLASRNYKFRKEPSEASSGKRSSQQTSELEIFTAADIVDVTPVVKSSVPEWPIPEACDSFELAKRALSGKDVFKAYERANEAMQLVIQVTGSAHTTVATCCTFISSILHQLGDTGSALATQRRALALLDRTGSLDTAQVADVHSRVASYYHALGQFDQAILHVRRSVYLRELMCGPCHTDISNLYLKMATIYTQAGKFQEALKSINVAIMRAQNDQLQQAQCRSASAQIFSRGPWPYSEAFKQEKIAYDIYTQLLGPQHSKTVEVGESMQKFLSKTVEMKQKQKAKELSEASHNATKKSKKGKKKGR